jgi:hypothetical protein
MAYTPGTDVWNVPSTFTKPRSVSWTPASLMPAVSTLGARPGGDEHLVDREVARLAVRLDGERHRVGADLDVAHLGRREHVDAAPLERLGHLGRRVGVLEREDLRGDVDERDLGAVGVEHVAELAAHGAGADDEHRLRRLLQHEHVVAREHRGLVQLEPDLREPLHARAGGDDDGLAGLVRLGLAVGPSDR